MSMITGCKRKFHDLDWQAVAQKTGIEVPAGAKAGAIRETVQKMRLFVKTLLRVSKLRLLEIPPNILESKQTTVEQVASLVEFVRLRDLLILMDHVNFFRTDSKQERTLVIRDIETLRKETDQFKSWPPLETFPIESLGLFGAFFEVPKQVFDFKRLKELDFSDSGLNQLPEGVATLGELQRLNVAKNKLTTLPASLANCTQLKSLNVGYNPLGKIPAVVFALSELTELVMSQCELRELPKRIGHLKKLECLDVYDNAISMLPKSILIPPLDELILTKNPISKLKNRLIAQLEAEGCEVRR